MPAPRRISGEAILNAATEVLRGGGFSAINARSVEKKPGCSTQPIYISFKSMTELKTALTEHAIALHTQRVRDSLKAREGKDSRYGMAFVQFAAEKLREAFRREFRALSAIYPRPAGALTSNRKAGDTL